MCVLLKLMLKTENAASENLVHGDFNLHHVFWPEGSPHSKANPDLFISNYVSMQYQLPT